MGFNGLHGGKNGLDGREWPRTAQNGLKLFSAAQNGPELLGMV